MDDKQIFRGMTGDRKEEYDEILKSRYSQTMSSESDAEAADRTGSFTEVNSMSRHISTEDMELSSAEVSVIVSPNQTRKETAVEHDVQIHFKSGLTTAVYVCSPCSVEGHQPKPLHSLLPPFTEIRKLPDVSQTLTKTRVQDSLKTSSANIEPGGSDLCAAILLGCLFCRPVDCLTETFRGCTVCFCSLCSSLFGCEPGALRPLLEFTRTCSPCACAGARRFLCDCAGCDVCLPVTECLDLAMEISQMLYH
ncbi:PREDICTED: uncharacterized protein LOC106904760 [Poecilia mexicana]|uniref:uncharacterized protein LOC106904760 n=1 Tax=Poecilia mexicana TaxID=48701 RepID=UPI00072E45D3|nr:PREDICTED: uncharacterized protein LOC106904760 [Poecilia mexicana]